MWWLIKIRKISLNILIGHRQKIRQAWQTIFFLWGAGGVPKDGTSACNNQDMPGGGKYPACLSSAPASSSAGGAIGNITCWTTTPDNFLWQGYGIPAQSPIIVAFQTQSANICTTNIIPDPNAMKILLGDQSAGAHAWSAYGWWGMIKDMGSTILKFDDFKDMIWSTIQIEGKGAAGAGATKTNTAACITSATSAGLGGFMSGAMGFDMIGAAELNGIFPQWGRPDGYCSAVVMGTVADCCCFSGRTWSGCSSSSPSPSS